LKPEPHSVWLPWDPALLDPDHPERRRLAPFGFDRLVLVWSEPPDPDEILRAAPRLGR